MRQAIKRFEEVMEQGIRLGVDGLDAGRAVNMGDRR
jgi:hypothetical protein